MDRAVAKYLSSRACVAPVHGKLHPLEVAAVIVIPAYCESGHLPLTIASLEALPTSDLARLWVLIVVNNPSPPEETEAVSYRVWREAREDNLALLAWLAERSVTSALHLAWIDAASSGNELSGKGGVGMARKLGCDSVVAVLAATNGDLGDASGQPVVLLHLDADTLVEPTYLSAVSELLASGCEGGAIWFQHQTADSARAQQAIDAYELYIHYYVAGLRLAGSPYAYHTVGSSMVCRADSYVRAGGIPAKRQAGEDFYFLQQLSKVGGVCSIYGTTVRPSPRISSRVPFGTGPQMGNVMERGERDLPAADPRVFGVLGDLFRSVRANAMAGSAAALTDLECPQTRLFLVEKRFGDVFSRISRQWGDGQRRVAAFHEWFDGLATHRLIHRLTAERWPALDVVAAWRALSDLLGLQLPIGGAAEILPTVREFLRRQ